MVDASAVLVVLLQGPGALEIEARMLGNGETLHAPFLLDIEVAQVIRRYTLAGEIDARRGGDALRDFIDLPVQRWPHEMLLPRIWDFRHNLTAYDAAYVALAEALDATLLTRDGRMASSAGAFARVMVV